MKAKVSTFVALVLLAIGCAIKLPPPPPPPDILPTPRPQMVVTVLGQDGAPITGSVITGELQSGTSPTVSATPDSFYELRFELPQDVWYGSSINLTIHASGHPDVVRIVPAAATLEVKVGTPKPKARRGVVHLIGKAWADDDGTFYPLTYSQLWALGGYMKGGAERQRAFDNMSWARAHGADAIRIIYHVDWIKQPYAGLIAGTPQALAEFLDAAYERGLRVKVTVHAGAPNPVTLAREVVSAVLPRRHTVLLLEGTNEQYAADAEEAVEVAKALAPAGVPFAVGWGTAGAEKVKELTQLAGANVAILHLERTNPAARRDRQAWDFHVFDTAADSGEPAGPGSSVASEDDPFHLAFQRLGSIAMGAGSWCLHTGAGIYGVDYQGPTGHRYANFGDTPNLDVIAAAVRGVDGIIRFTGIENWKHTNNPIPLEVNRGQVDKQYYARAGKDFLGIITDTFSGPISFKENEPIESFTLYSPLTGAAQNGGIPGYMIIGRVR